jgi:periplasmic divalent cation tolerance protein
MANFSRYGMILTTVGSREAAVVMAQALVEKRLAACVNYFPVESVYRWQDTVQQDPEWQLLIKTDLALLEVLEAEIRALHPYELPELMVLPIQGGSAAYLEWMGQQVRG